MLIRPVTIDPLSGNGRRARRAGKQPGHNGMNTTGVPPAAAAPT